MVKIGVCDVNEDEISRTIYLLESQIKNFYIGTNNVTFVKYTIDLVMLDLDDQKFDCDIFITELSFQNGSNGVSLAKKINAIVPSCNIIFFTNKIPYELDVYESRHVNCMLKGRHDARLVMVTAKLIEQINDDMRRFFIKIKYDRNIVILDCREIMYIRIESRVTKFYTTKTDEKNSGIFYEYKPLSEIIKNLPNNFVRCSAATIVNKDYIQRYNHQMITMMDGTILKVGRRYGDVMNNKL